MLVTVIKKTVFLHLAVFTVMDVNQDFLFYVTCYNLKRGKCEFMDAEVMGRKLVRKSTY